MSGDDAARHVRRIELRNHWQGERVQSQRFEQLLPQAFQRLPVSVLPILKRWPESKYHRSIQRSKQYHNGVELPMAPKDEEGVSR